MKVLISLIIVLFSGVAFAGILPMSRGGTGANLIPSSGSIVTSTASTLQVTSSLLVPAGGSIVLAAGGTTASHAALYIPAGSDLTTPEAGAIESDGTHLYWTNGAGSRQLVK